MVTENNCNGCTLLLILKTGRPDWSLPKKIFKQSCPVLEQHPEDRGDRDHIVQEYWEEKNTEKEGNCS